MKRFGLAAILMICIFLSAAVWAGQATPPRVSAAKQAHTMKCAKMRGDNAVMKAKQRAWAKAHAMKRNAAKRAYTRKSARYGVQMHGYKQHGTLGAPAAREKAMKHHQSVK